MRWLKQFWLLLLPACRVASATDVGVYYFSGWVSRSSYWFDLKGLPDSRSPNVMWSAREPLLGYFAEENIKLDASKPRRLDIVMINVWYEFDEGAYIEHIK